MSFTEATAVQQTGSHTYTANLHPDWVIGSVPHGGFVTSVLLRVVRTHFTTTLAQQAQPHTLALHLSFLRRTGVGPATVHVKDIKLGRQTSVVHVSLSQDGREEVVGYVTNADISGEKGASFPTPWRASPDHLPIPPADLKLLATNADPHWVEKPAWPNERFRKATARIRSWFPRAGQPGQAVSDQWMKLREGEGRWTHDSLGFLVDCFPQLLESFLLEGFDPYHPDADLEEVERRSRTKDVAFWYPTLLLNLEVKRALPEEGVEFLFTRVQAKVISNGRYDLEVIVLNGDGQVVALSHHVCFAVSAARNVAARRKVEEKKDNKL